MSKRILVTGGAGFIGHHLIDYLLETTDWNITCLDRLDHAGNLSRLVSMPQWVTNSHRVKVVYHDLRAAVGPGAAYGIGGAFDYVAHLAAGSHVDRSIKDPVGFIQDNVVGTANLLNFCLADGVLTSSGKVLVFSTDEVFGPAGPNDLFDEGARQNPNNPYAASKSGSELLCPAYANTYGMRLVVTRCANVFGERQDSEKFIPLVIRKVLTGEVVQIHARLDDEDNFFGCAQLIPSSRLYTYHRNVTSAVRYILENGNTIQGEDASTGRYNISGGEEQSNLAVAERIAELLGKSLSYELVTDPPGRPRPDQRYAIDASRLRRLGWEPSVSFSDGLKLVVESELRRLNG